MEREWKGPSSVVVRVKQEQLKIPKRSWTARICLIAARQSALHCSGCLHLPCPSYHASTWDGSAGATSWQTLPALACRFFCILPTVSRLALSRSRAPRLNLQPAVHICTNPLACFATAGFVLQAVKGSAYPAQGPWQASVDGASPLRENIWFGATVLGVAICSHCGGPLRLSAQRLT